MTILINTIAALLAAYLVGVPACAMAFLIIGWNWKDALIVAGLWPLLVVGLLKGE